MTDISFRLQKILAENYFKQHFLNPTDFRLLFTRARTNYTTDKIVFKHRKGQENKTYVIILKLKTSIVIYSGTLENDSHFIITF